MMMVLDPLAGGELEEQGAVEAAVRTKVDVLDNRGLAQPSLAQTAGEALILAAGCLPVREEPEPILPRQRGGVGDVLQFDEGVGHGGEAERAQPLDQRMDHTGRVLSDVTGGGGFSGG